MVGWAPITLDLCDYVQLRNNHFWECLKIAKWMTLHNTFLTICLIQLHKWKGLFIFQWPKFQQNPRGCYGCFLLLATQSSRMPVTWGKVGRKKITKQMKQWLKETLNGRNPARKPPGMYKTLVNTGISTTSTGWPDFWTIWTINSMKGLAEEPKHKEPWNHHRRKIRPMVVKQTYISKITNTCICWWTCQCKIGWDQATVIWKNREHYKNEVWCPCIRVRRPNRKDV